MALGIIAFVLGIAWIFGFFVFHVGGAAIHILLAVAVIITIVRISKKPAN